MSIILYFALGYFGFGAVIEINKHNSAGAWIYAVLTIATVVAIYFFERARI